jgi:hypothetical protein
MALSRVSPLAVPVLLEIGRENVAAAISEEDLLAEAMGKEEKNDSRANLMRGVPGQSMLLTSP